LNNTALPSDRQRETTQAKVVCNQDGVLVDIYY